MYVAQGCCALYGSMRIRECSAKKKVCFSTMIPIRICIGKKNVKLQERCTQTPMYDACMQFFLMTFLQCFYQSNARLRNIC